MKSQIFNHAQVIVSGTFLGEVHNSRLSHLNFRWSLRKMNHFISICISVSNFQVIKSIFVLYEEWQSSFEPYITKYIRIWICKLKRKLRSKMGLLNNLQLISSSTLESSPSASGQCDCRRRRGRLQHSHGESLRHGGRGDGGLRHGAF